MRKLSRLTKTEHIGKQGQLKMFKDSEQFFGDNGQSKSTIYF